jgi:hypothetical protein
MGKNGVLGWPTWIGVIVEDLEGQRRFWGDLLGVSEDHSGPDFVDFELGDWRSFEVIQRSSIRRPEVPGRIRSGGHRGCSRGADPPWC